MVFCYTAAEDGIRQVLIKKKSLRMSECLNGVGKGEWHGLYSIVLYPKEKS